ncbi:hypothetical protein LJR230_005040 [Trinickia sp. LjRoot230]|uniref:hypothetical protein n=1 Tax=Trinickia sp. LjRoot230 TaxID=3342288 RepID=UPI003ECEB62A
MHDVIEASEPSQGVAHLDAKFETEGFSEYREPPIISYYVRHLDDPPSLLFGEATVTEFSPNACADAWK